MKAAYFALLFEPSKAVGFLPGGFGPGMSGLGGGGLGGFAGLGYGYPENPGLVVNGKGDMAIPNFRETDQWHIHETGGDDDWLDDNDLEDLKMDDVDDVKDSKLRELIHFSGAFRLFLEGKKKLRTVINVSRPTQDIIEDLWEDGESSNFGLDPDGSGKVNKAWRDEYSETSSKDKDSYRVFNSKYKIDEDETGWFSNNEVKEDLRELYNAVLTARVHYATSKLPHQFQDDITGKIPFNPFTKEGDSSGDVLTLLLMTHLIEELSKPSGGGNEGDFGEGGENIQYGMHGPSGYHSGGNQPGYAGDYRYGGDSGGYDQVVGGEYDGYPY